MNTEQLQLFMEIVRLKNISRASENCNISQPAASIKLKNLEDSLGVRLFERTGGRFRLSHAGRLFYEKAEKILAIEEDIQRDLNILFKPEDLLLNFGATTGPGNYILPKIISDFHKDNPDVYIKMDVGSKDQILEAVKNNLLDFAVVGSYGIQRLKYVPVLKDRILLCTAGDLKDPESISVKDLPEISIYLEQKNSSSRKVFENWLQKHNVMIQDLKCIGEVGLPDALKKIVKLGTGMAFLPETLIDAEIKGGELREVKILDADPLFRDLYLAYDEKHRRSANEQNFIENYLNNL